eukprot:198943-Pelagomonas_calceolata.AAC.1
MSLSGIGRPCSKLAVLLVAPCSQRPYGLEDEDEDEEAGAKDEEGSSRKRQAIEDSGGSVQGAHCSDAN